MALVLVLCAGFWGLGMALNTPKPMRWAMIGMMLVAVILLHFVLPQDNPLRMATGETAMPWLLLLGAAALVWAYRKGLSQLRNRAQPADQPETDAPLFSDTELNRYARHIVMREVGGPGQKALKQAKVLVIGAGGLGAPALQYLAATGVGTIGVVDDDVVENANLQRQVIHRDQDIGMPKVFSAQAAMTAQNPHVTVRPYHRRLGADDARELIADYDLVLDGCDNFETRYLVNSACVDLGKPLISGALTQWEGQLSVFDPKNASPCYQCIFPQAPAPELAPSCAEAGVIGPLPGVIGSMMAIEAIKVLTGAGTPLRGELLIYDALYGESRKIMIAPRADCPVCGG
jgi:molybdopterin/thiamine biosynthesis adenylyltransferase